MDRGLEEQILENYVVLRAVILKLPYKRVRSYRSYLREYHLKLSRDQALENIRHPQKTKCHRSYGL